MKKYTVYSLKEKDGTIVYIGLTRQAIEARLRRHRNNKNFPHHNYRCEIIQTFDIPEPAYELERMLIIQYNTIEYGWNSRNGHTIIPSQLPNKGRTGLSNSNEHKAILIESRQRRVMCIETGEVFESGRKAAEKMNLQRSKISNVCNGIRKTTGGYTFIFVD
jgi:hypothetical protein